MVYLLLNVSLHQVFILFSCVFDKLIMINLYMTQPLHTFSLYTYQLDVYINILNTMRVIILDLHHNTDHTTFHIDRNYGIQATDEREVLGVGGGIADVEFEEMRRRLG